MAFFIVCQCLKPFVRCDIFLECLGHVYASAGRSAVHVVFNNAVVALPAYKQCVCCWYIGYAFCVCRYAFVGFKTYVFSVFYLPTFGVNGDIEQEKTVALGLIRDDGIYIVGYMCYSAVVAWRYCGIERPLLTVFY